MRISTIYDEKVGKVFMVRGDEAYARTTNVLFDIITDSTSANALEGYKVGFKYNVLRDVGSSGVSLYDGDMLLAKYEWDEDDGETFIGVDNTHTHIDSNTCLYLSYGVDHNLYMKYHGNNQCLKSKSKPVLVNEPLPQQFKSNIAFTSVDVNNHSVTISLKLTVNGVSSSVTRDKTIELYVDDEDEYKTVTTDNNGEATYTLTNLPYGVHQITASLQGTTDIHPTVSTEMVALGYYIDAMSCPKPFINGLDNTVVISVKDTANEPVVGETVSFMSMTATTDSDGLATFEDIMNVVDGKYRATCGGFESDEVEVIGYTPVITITSSEDYVPFGVEYTVTASLSEPVPNVPVRLTVDYAFPVSQTYYTDSDGKVIIDYVGKYRGTVSFTSDVIYEIPHSFNYNVLTSDSTNVNEIIYHFDSAHQDNKYWNQLKSTGELRIRNAKMQVLKSGTLSENGATLTTLGGGYTSYYNNLEFNFEPSDTFQYMDIILNTNLKCRITTPQLIRITIAHYGVSIYNSGVEVGSYSLSEVSNDFWLRTPIYISSNGDIGSVMGSISQIDRKQVYGRF